MMNDQPSAIIVKNLYKTFRLPHEKHSGLKQAAVNIFNQKRGYETQKVLSDISFEIKKGDFFGIVGRNGSGKSTLLKLLASIYVPDSGSIQVNGSLTPFIELGVGFNPELTGRENVFLNGALLGFNKNEMAAMYEDIVGFAELQDFMDQKLKNYSSGMQVRLAFSIAIRAESDILLLDEVLAVGDESFQRKCYSYFDQLKMNKKTVILVTHDMGAVERFCNKAIMIEGGRIVHRGRPHMVSSEYSRANHKDSGQERKNTHEDIIIELLGSNGEPKKKFGYNEELTVKMSWGIDNAHIAGVAIYREDGQYIFGPNTYQDKYTFSKPNQVEYKVKLNLNEGRYFIKAGIASKSDVDWLAFVDNGPIFTVERDYDHGRWGGFGKLEYRWK